jgi:glycosyltransferase involved in cell wall biosynthesis
MYDVEEYVERCIRSLENQDISTNEYEIICINDGSPDNCREIILMLQKEFDNIILIDKKNQGVSLARNDGICKATGKYLLFIDPDDYVESNCLKRIVNSANNKLAQVSFLGFISEYNDGTFYKPYFKDEYADKLYDGIDAYFISRLDPFHDPDRIWAVLFDKEFIKQNDLRYLPNLPFLEDGEFIARILCLAKRCIFDMRPFYKRTIRQGSATNSNLFYSQSAINGFINAAVSLRNFRNNPLLNAKQKEFLNQPVAKFVILAISATAKPSKYKMFRNVVLNLRVNNIDYLELLSCRKPFNKLGALYNITPMLLYLYLITKSGFKYISKRNALIKNKGIYNK